MYRNKEGYADPTAGSALSHMMKEYRQKQKKSVCGVKVCWRCGCEYNSGDRILPQGDTGWIYADC